MPNNLVGQEQAVKLLEQAINRDRIAPAYLFMGLSGVGRSIAAKNFARSLLTRGLALAKHSLVDKKITTGNHPDLLWVTPTYLHQGELYTVHAAKERGLASKTSPKIRIEQIRTITEFLNRPLWEATRKVVIIEDAQTMAEAPANALLKTLEEPGNATLILIAPNEDTLLTTLVSRCQRIQFYGLSRTNLVTVLTKQGYPEIIEHPEIIAIAQGSPGKAIADWQQLQTIPQELLQQLTQPTSHHQEVFLSSIIPTPLQAFTIAQAITQELDLKTQLWLVDYLQYYYWQQIPQLELMQQWETTRKHLLSYVQPRLVWECALLNLMYLLDEFYNR